MGYIKAGNVSELVEGEIKTLHTKFGRVGLALVEGEVLAFEDTCTHDDGSLAGGELKNCIITCPRHGAEFDIKTGEVLKLPATEDIEVYKVRITGDEIEVELD